MHTWGEKWISPGSLEVFVSWDTDSDSRCLCTWNEMALQDWKRNAEKLTVEVVGKLWKVKSVAFDCHCAHRKRKDMKIKSDLLHC